nr:reverse transcriptase domain-containing protein [Tanacetum cinerariifolium]
MSGRSTRSNPANNTNPPNEIADEVARQLNTALPNLLNQLVQALRGNQANQGDVTQSCSYKTFRFCGAKEFFGTEDAVGLLTLFKGIEVVLYISKFPTKSQVKFASCMLQGHALTWWNTLVQTRGRATVIAQPFEDFKKLLMKKYYPNDEIQKEQCVNGYIQGLAPEIKINVTSSKPNTIQSTVTMANRLTTDGNPNQGNNRNQARGRAFSLGVAEAPQDPNIVTGTFSLNDHFATVLFDFCADYSFISTKFLPFIDMKTSVINPGYEIKIANDLKVETNQIVQGCILELEGHTFIINLIPFGHGSFDMIMGMDWSSKRRAKMVCFEKIVQIPLSNEEILKSHSECPEGNQK